MFKQNKRTGAVVYPIAFEIDLSLFFNHLSMVHREHLKDLSSLGFNMAKLTVYSR